jgi:hypothetical protein
MNIQPDNLRKEWQANADNWISKMETKYGLLGCTIKRTISGEVLLSLYFVDGVSYSGTMDKACAINYSINEEEPINASAFCNVEDKKSITMFKSYHGKIITKDQSKIIFNGKTSLKTYLTHLMGLANAMIQILYINEHTIWKGK